MHRAVALSLHACLLLAFGAALTGCGHDDTDDFAPVEIQKRMDDRPVVQRSEEIAVRDDFAYDTPKNSPESVGDAVPGADRPFGFGGNVGDVDVRSAVRGSDADYIDKSDVYWKLNWIRKCLLAGPLPTNFAEAVAKTRKQLKTTERDNNYTVADEAVSHLERGLEHRQAGQALASVHASRSLIPWGAGRAAIQRFIDSNGLGFGGKPREIEQNSDRSTDVRLNDQDLMDVPSGATSALARPSLSAAESKAIDIIFDYEERFHASPDKMMKREWKLAIQQINKLRDNLGLMKRKENSDGDSSEPASDALPPSNAGSDAKGESTGVQDVVPVPSTGSPSEDK